MLKSKAIGAATVISFGFGTTAISQLAYGVAEYGPGATRGDQNQATRSPTVVPLLPMAR
jgi:hypothetical protein